MMNELNISTKWKCIVLFFKFLRGSNKCPEIIYKLSKKYFGLSNDLARYWIFKYNKVSIGKYTYGYEKLISGKYLKSIGAYTSIANGVKIIPNSHNYNFVTTSPILFDTRFKFPCKSDVLKTYCPDLYYSVEIGNDVWIGENVIIFNGIKIGDGAVIAAGSIIRKNVPPYAIVVGVDKIIKFRFEKDNIEKLIKIKWWDWDEKLIIEKFDKFYNVNNFLNNIV